MKVQLIVVQGKPEGKIIPLVGPVFRIGRGETCQLKPNSEQVSREHAEFQISADSVVVRDLGSRNGTLVNGKAITEPCRLKDRDLVQIGHLTFAVAIQGAPAPPTATAKPPSKPATPEDVSHDDIESWLVADAKNQTPERESGVYAGDTMTMAAFKDTTAKETAAKETTAKETAAKETAAKETAAKVAATKVTTTSAKPKDDEVSDRAEDEVEYERLPEGEGDGEEQLEEEEDDDESAEDEAPAEDFVDESNPFYVKKKTAGPEQPAKPTFKDTSDAANEILRKMMERRRSK